jgi:hypothetical protein
MQNSEKNLQGKSYKGQTLPDADFSGADLRGTDFTEAVITNANFSKCKTGLKTSSAVLIFILALIISMLSGYIAMLTGDTVQTMIKSSDPKIVTSGYIVTGLMVIFVLLAIWKGGKNTLVSVIVTIAAVLLTGLISYISGIGTGIGSLYASLALVLFVAMIIVGTIARASAGTLSSNIIFLIVAVGGGMFGKNLGGGLGTVILAVACAVISKSVLSGKGDFPLIKKIALTVGSYFGTSFKNADLTGADFSESEIKNTNFSGAKLSDVNWENSKKKFNLDD